MPLPRRTNLAALTAPLTFALSFGAYALISRPASHPPREVAPGVTISIEDLTADGKSSGRLFLARIKLDPANLDLFITPPDPSLPAPFLMRLAHTQTVSRDHHLTVAINACLFLGGSWPIRRVGQPAHPIETTVVDGTVVRLWEHTYLIGFTPDLTPQPQPNKPPPKNLLPTWKWAIGHQGWSVFAGKSNPNTDPTLGRRTAVGVNPDTRELFLAVFDSASVPTVIRELPARGATWVGTLDGSESSTFVLNGTPLTGDWRPVANHIGITAAPQR